MADKVKKQKQPTVFLLGEYRCQWPVRLRNNHIRHCGAEKAPTIGNLHFCNPHWKEYMKLEHGAKRDIERLSYRASAPRYRARLQQCIERVPELRKLLRSAQELRTRYREIEGISFSGPFASMLRILESDLFDIAERLGFKGFEDFYDDDTRRILKPVRRASRKVKEK